MKIQEFAQLAGLSTKTIRYYESIGILILRDARQMVIANTTKRIWRGRALSLEYALSIYHWTKLERFWQCRIEEKHHAEHC